MSTNSNSSNSSARDLFSSLKTKAASQTSLLRKQSSSWFSKQDEQHEPSLPLPNITHPFPVIEQPSRVLLKSLNYRESSFDEQYFLSSNKRGLVTASTSRSEREQFLLIPVTANTNEENTNTATTATKKDMFYLKSYKFNRYLSSIYSGSITTVDFADKNEDWRDQELGESEKWILMSSPYGGHFVISAQNEQNLACHRGDKSLTVGLKGDNDLSESWEVEFVSGELLFVSSWNQRQIRCDLIGNLTLTQDRRGWEVWRFIETGGGKVRIVSWMHPFCIVCNHEGKVTTAAVGQAEVGYDEWTVEKAPDGYTGVIIKSVGCEKRILFHGGEGLSLSEVLEESGVWRLDAAHSQTYSLTSVHHGRSIGPFPLVSDNIKESDQIMLQQIDNQGTVRLYHTHRGEYLQSYEAGQVVCIDVPPEESDETSLWNMESRPDGGYTFTSKSDNQLLAFSTDEEDPSICTVPDITDDKREVWAVNPILPRAVSSDKIKTFAIGTSVAVGTTIAMPFLMVGMVAALPAEATLAASILSVGLTTAEAAASVGAIGATAYIVFREDSNTLGMDTEENEHETNVHTKRPFCAWRSW